LNSDYNLNNIKLDVDLFLCDDDNCKNHAHINSVDRLYNNIVSALTDASANIRSSVRAKYTEPGWNEYCSEAHSQARDAFLLWCSHGKPRNGSVWQLMQKTRLHFKYSLRCCRNNTERASADSMARKLLTKDTKAFWREIKKCSGGNTHTLATTVNNATGHNDIANMWQQHYSKLLNSCDNVNLKKHVISQLKDCKSHDNMKVETVEIVNAIHKLKNDKCAGLDGLNSEHYKYASDRLAILLSLLYTACIVPGYLPKELMDGFYYNAYC